MKGWLLDTNVVSELQRQRPDPRVVAWLDSLPQDRSFISILTLAEIDQGIEMLALDDERRTRHVRFRTRTETNFVGRILALDDATVRH